MLTIFSFKLLKILIYINIFNEINKKENVCNMPDHVNALLKILQKGGLKNKL